MASEKVIPTQCQRVVAKDLKAAHSLEELALKISCKKGFYIAMNLNQAQQEVPIRIMNMRNQDQVLAEGTTLSHCKPVMWAASANGLEPQTPWTQGLCKQLQEVVSGNRLNLNNGEIKH
jgi:hypothetical protein